MKKVLLIMVAVLGFAFAANAQNAIGLRFGGGSSYGEEISYQKDLGANRLEFDLGANLPSLNFFYLAGIYQKRKEALFNYGWRLARRDRN